MSAAAPNPETAGLRELAQALQNRQISPAELRDFFRERIRKHARLNAFIQTGADADADASANAENIPDSESDSESENKIDSPLRGVPVAHKDIFCVKGARTTCGSRMLENFVAPYTAAVAQKCADAGMPLLGKTNMDEFAMGSSGEHSFFGPARNPWDEARAPGGSSSGSAVAVAAGLAPIATGTDTGGSIRQPAAFCGVSGIKPTYGRASRWGLVAFASSFDQAGIFARRAEDCALGLNVICGFDPRDSTSLEVPDENFAREIENGKADSKPLAGKTVGVPKEFFAEGLSDIAAQKTREAISEMEKLGATAREISLPSLAAAIPAYYVLTCAEASSNLARYDGVRYGRRAEGAADLRELYCKSRAEGFGREVKLRILAGTFVLSHGYYDAYYRRAAKIRRMIADDFARAFAEGCDVVAGPATPDSAFKLGAIGENDPVQMYMQDVFTVPASLAGLPAMSVPCGFCAEGMPLGLQLIGPRLGEARVLGVAHHYQTQTDFHLQAPNLQAPNSQAPETTKRDAQ